MNRKELFAFFFRKRDKRVRGEGKKGRAFMSLYNFITILHKRNKQIGNVFCSFDECNIPITTKSDVFFFLKLFVLGYSSCKCKYADVGNFNEIIGAC